ncbi:MAG: UDP-3-O-(3-hydroxymyristoyl)glucosamine N-acyltransferase [Chitinophagaceae bacterium]
MQFPSPVSTKWIADFIGAEISGLADGHATGINEIHNVQTGDLVFVDHPKYFDACLKSAASFIIINKSVDVPEGKTLLIVEEPFEAYLKIVKHFRPFEPSYKPISDTATVGEGTIVMPNVFLGNHVSIGKNCILHPNITIYDHTTIGNKVVIHSGTVIGSDAFYYNTKKNRDTWFKKMDSCGRVLIEDDVELGACCTIVRGVSADTVIGRGSKFDNMVHIGHDVVIGKNCLFAAQVAVAGCTIIGDGVTLWGQVGINKNLHIGNNATIYAQSGLGVDVPAGQSYFGSPAEPARAKAKELVWVKRIPELWGKVMEEKSKE